MKRIALLISRFLEAWFVLIPIGLGCLHYYIVANCSVDVSEMNKIASLVLQITGGLLIVYSIDSTIGIVSSLSLVGMAKKWVLSIFFSLFSKSVTVNVGTGNLKMTGLQCKVRTGASDDTVEGKIKYLQQQVDWLKEDLDDEIKHVKDMHIKSEKSLNEKISTLNTKVSETDRKFNKVSLGGIKVQLFGILLMIHGSISSYLA
jgi:hypothetical protein